jgi:hypothetical protein
MPAKPTKRAKGSVREGEAGKKAKATQHAGGKSVREKSQATHTSKNLLEKCTHQEYFVDVVKDRQVSLSDSTSMDVDVDMWRPS